MSNAKYAIGDLVMLRDGPLRHARTEAEFKIIQVLPDTFGQVQYRVRSEVEGFDRRVMASDIDTDKSATSSIAPDVSIENGAKEPWFNASSIKVRK